jgi:hypothetical protein
VELDKVLLNQQQTDLAVLVEEPMQEQVELEGMEEL